MNPELETKLGDWQLEKTALEKKVRALEAEVSKQRDLGTEVDSLREDFRMLEDVRRRTPALEEEFERMDKLRKRYEEKIRLFHKLTKYITKRESSSGKK